MALPQLLYTDLTHYTFTGSVGSGSTGYTTDNLKNYIPSSRFVGGDLLSSLQYFVIDLGSARSANAVAIERHNFDSIMTEGSGSVYLEAATDAAFTTDVVTVVADLISSEPIIYHEFNTLTKRYYRIVFDGVLLDQIYIGNIFIDQLMQFNIPYQYGYKTNNYISSTAENRSIRGTIKNAGNYTSKIIHELEFKLLNETTRQDFKEIISSIRGKSTPLYFIDIDGTASYVNLTSDYTPLSVMQLGLNDINTMQFIGNSPYIDANTFNNIYVELIYEDELIESVS